MRFLVGVWAALAIYSYVKGMKQGSFPLMLSYPGAALVAAIGFALVLGWWISQIPEVMSKWRVAIEGDVHPSTSQTESGGSAAEWGWFVFGLGLLGAALCWLEYREPYYFAQDDNLAQFLPVILQGCEGLFDRGVFPTYNPNQFAGAPTSSLGVYALTYPLTYASYGFARYILWRPEATLDVFCILHLLLGYPAAFALLRRLGCSAALSTGGCLSFLLQGFFLVHGRSWFYMCPVALWLPCLFLLAEQLRRGWAPWWWTLATGVVIGGFFHSGNVQMWAYSMAVWCLLLALWFWTGAIDRRGLWRVAGALLVGLGVSLPLLVPQFQETLGVKRMVGGASIDSSALGLLLPWPLFRSGDVGPSLVGAKNIELIGESLYSGTVFVGAAVVVMASLMVHRWRRETFRENAYAPLALLTFAAALGTMGLVWFLLSKAPLFSKFAQPQKFVPLFVFFAVLSGGVVLERILRSLNRRGLTETLIVFGAIVLLAYHVSLPLPSLYSYAFVPYPEPIEELVDVAPVLGRVMTIAPYRHPAEEFGRMPVNNLPTAQDLLALGGYDPLAMRREPVLTMLGHLGHRETYDARGVRRLGEPQVTAMATEEGSKRIAALRAYGVTKIFVFGLEIEPPFDAGDRNYVPYKGDAYLWQIWESIKSLPQDEVIPLGGSPWGAIYGLTGADPLAYIDKEEKPPQAIVFSTRGATVELRGAQAADDLVINVVDEPGRTYLRAYVDGKAAPITVDDYKRVRIALSEGAKRVELRYEPPFLRWLGIGMLLVGLGLVFDRLGARCERS